MNFSEVLDALKAGKKVARSGWNGKGMFLYLPHEGSIQYAYPPLPENHAWDYGAFDYAPFIVMKTADDKLVPWLASQTDILADDWDCSSEENI